MPGNRRGLRLGPDQARGPGLTIFIDGRPVTAFEGETIAAAMVVQGLLVNQIRNGRAQGVFCNIGQCHGCLVEVDGRTGVKACVTLVAEGMQISTRRVDVRRTDHEA